MLFVLQLKTNEVRAQRAQLKRIEELGAAMEERLILDNRCVHVVHFWEPLPQPKKNKTKKTNTYLNIVLVHLVNPSADEIGIFQDK